MWGAQEKSTSKNFRPALRAGIVPLTCKLLPTPLLGLGLGLAVLVFFCETRSCNVRRRRR